LREVEQMLIERRIPYLRESGRPGLYQNKYAAAVRAYQKLQGGELLTESERSSIFAAATLETRRTLEAVKIPQSPFYVALDIPARVVDFYMDADLSVTPTIRLSTIHAAKGHEADQVVLLTDMTNRVVQSTEKNPDDECRVFYVGMTRSKDALDIVEGHNGYKLE
jgi:superfamily I DNA/RNA helicase